MLVLCDKNKEFFFCDASDCSSGSDESSGEHLSCAHSVHDSILMECLV